LVYLLDANVLIIANRQYYPIERVPAFWDWLLRQGVAGNIKIVEEVFDEFTGGNDVLTEWAKQQAVEDALLFSESVDVSLLRRVMSSGYAPDLTDDEVEQLGRDPFLIAHALRSPRDRVVVTLEASKPSRQRANRHVPDVCRAVGVQCIDTFEMTSALDFRI
jgi:hypothetical protein